MFSLLSSPHTPRSESHRGSEALPEIYQQLFPCLFCPGLMQFAPNLVNSVTSSPPARPSSSQHLPSGGCSASHLTGSSLGAFIFSSSSPCLGFLAAPTPFHSMPLQVSCTFVSLTPLRLNSLKIPFVSLRPLRFKSRSTAAALFSFVPSSNHVWI